MGEVGLIRNPLTIIAVFAGLVEVSATFVLPMIDRDLQRIFIWFLMCFPTLLVILFFLVLVLKPKSLYAPKDFREDKSFVDIHAPQEVSFKGAKIEGRWSVVINSGGEANVSS